MVREPAGHEWGNPPVAGEPAYLADYYSPDYFIARRRFIAACARLAIDCHSLPIEAKSPGSEPLSINVAFAGAPHPTTAIVVSSGIHGVEGFFGSAVQLAYLEKLPPNWRPPGAAALVFIHALNPFGFAWRRRFNEDNVDLNRNFLLPDEKFTGSPPLTAAFRRVLAPRPALARISHYPAGMAYLALRHGVQSFWETLPVGQYDYPDWLYFGGHAPSQTARALDGFLPSLLDQATEIVHLDFHTGLGKWATYQLLLSAADDADDIAWWKHHFGDDHVSGSASPNRYEIRGGFGPWLQSRFPNCRYRHATAEFGTYSPVRIIRALVDELRWHTKLGTQLPDHWARRRLAEAFVPRDRRWRIKTLQVGLALIQRAADVLWQPADRPMPIVAPNASA